jgi:hypothetical protein
VSIPSFSRSHANAESPDVPGGVDIASVSANVSPVVPVIIGSNFVIASAAKQSMAQQAESWIASLRSQ